MELIKIVRLNPYLCPWWIIPYNLYNKYTSILRNEISPCNFSFLSDSVRVGDINYIGRIGIILEKIKYQDKQYIWALVGNEKILIPEHRFEII